MRRWEPAVSVLHAGAPDLVVPGAGNWFGVHCLGAFDDDAYAFAGRARVDRGYLSLAQISLRRIDG